MFKLESYITPLILSYVDKYIKNLKPEDSQFSLWGGDAVFSNLDLRLDVLERELSQLPFTFLNGHIHELRIHVPWTKLVSEPIVVTINTIECILKLQDSSNDECSSTSSGARKVDGSKKKSRPEEIEVPTGYVKSLVNKIVNNIKIIFNNVILKYVEDDIVLSLNVKSAEIFTANEKWESAFLDISLPELALRKLIKLTDLTICLDKRNASGKIEVYQDPLLYRCSLVCRWYTRFNSLYSKQYSNVRLDVYCDELDFSVTDQQIPMLMRLLHLVLALYYGRIGDPKTTQSEDKIDEINDFDVSKSEEEDIQFLDDQSWGSWAMSFVPSILAYEEDLESSSDLKKFNSPVSQFSILINKASVTFKVTKLLKESQHFNNISATQEINKKCSSKIIFEPFLTVDVEGTGFLATLQSPQFVEIVFGISKIKAYSIGNCLCGVKDCSAKTSDIQDGLFLSSGLSSKRNNVNYMKGSLYDPDSHENQCKQRSYELSFDACIERQFSAGNEGYSLWDKYGAFMLHSLYILNLPSDWSEKSSEYSLNETFLESSNFNEKATCRLVFGESCLDVHSSMVHRINNILLCIERADENPYGSLQEEQTFTFDEAYKQDEIKSVEDCMPFRTFEISVLRPTINVFIANHSSEALSKKCIDDKTKKKSVTTNKKKDACILPVISINAQEVHFHLFQLMYPNHVTKAALSSQEYGAMNTNIFDNLYAKINVKTYNLEAHLTNSHRQNKVCIVPSSSIVYSSKRLLLQKAWEKHLDFITSEQSIEVSQIDINISKPHLYLLTNILNSWRISDPDPSRLVNTSLLADALPNSNENATLMFQISNFDSTLCETHDIKALKANVGSVIVKMKSTADKEICLFQGPDNVNGVHSTNFLSPTKSSAQSNLSMSRTLPGIASSKRINKFFSALIQLPRNPEQKTSRPYLALLQIQGFTCLIDPILLKWLSYQPKLTAEGHSSVAMLSDIDDAMSSNTNDCSTQSCAQTDSEQQQLFSNTPSYPGTSVGNSPSLKLGSKTAKERSTNNYYGQLCSIFKDIFIQIQINSSCIFVPSHSFSSIAAQKNLSLSIKQALNSDSHCSIDMLVITLPVFHLFSSTIQKQFQVYEPPNIPHSIPVYKFMDLTSGTVQYPWTVEVSNFSVYTWHKSESVSKANYVINNLGLSSTVAVNVDAKEKSKPFGFCVHVDMEPLHLNFSIKQMQLISELGCFIAKLIPLIIQPPDLISNLNQATLHNLTSTSPIMPIVPNLKSSSSQNFVEELPSLASLNIKSFDEVSELSDIDEENIRQNEANKHCTLWLQWTLPKVCLNVFSSDGVTDEWLMSELEDLTTSFDIQDVYLKIKSKIGAFNVTTFCKNHEGEEWDKNKHGGILLSCSDKIPHQLLVLDTKTGVDQILPHQSLFETSNTSNGETPNHAFFTITYTQVLSKDVHSKLSKQNYEDVTSKRLLSSTSHKSLTEIELKIHPMDIVVQPRVILKSFLVFQPFIDVIIAHLPSEIPCDEVYPIAWDVNVKNLPLLHVNSNTVRIFLFDHGSRDINVKAHDIAMIQIDSISIIPSADNPLSRQVLLPEIYSAAKKILNIPGSVLEDRQYQMDLVGISLSTGCWQDFVDAGNLQKLEKNSTSASMGENPALEWNTKGLSGVNKDVNILLHPIVSRFDLKVIFAPAMVYTPENYDLKLNQELLVSGISAEVNAVSEIVISFNLDQFDLLQSIVLSNLSRIKMVLPDFLSSEVKDSGFDSEMSYVNSSVDKESKDAVFNQISSMKTKRNFIPFDLLLTTSSISFITYFHEDSIPEWSTLVNESKSKRRTRRRRSNVLDKKLSSSDLTIENIPSSNCKAQLKGAPIVPAYNSSDDTDECHGYEGSDDSIYSEVTKSAIPCRRIVPFLYVSFIQPHTFVNCHPSYQKLEVSCFDLSIKSSPPGTFISNEKRMIPCSFNFKLPWIETMSGEPNKKTGIPPCLIFLRAVNFLNENGSINIDIGRPIKVNASLSKVEEFLLYSKKLKSNFRLFDALSKSEQVVENKISPSKLKTEENFALRIKDVSLSTVQVVLILETVHHPENSHVILSANKIGNKIKINSNDDSYGIDNLLEMDGFILLTSFNSVKHVLFGPCPSVSVRLCMNWLSLVNNKPLTSIVFKTEAVPMKIKQEHVQCLQLMLEKCKSHHLLAAFFTGSQYKSPTKVAKNQTHLKQYFDDDLRRGKFQYIQNTDKIPEPYEITFQSEATYRNPSCMTWCYPQPRFLSTVDVYPVPFYSISSKHQTDQKVKCKLQYWDNLREMFVDYKTFYIKEACHCTVDIDDGNRANNSDKSPFAVIWRILLDIPESKQKKNDGQLQSKISPLSLAACLKVNSVYDPDKLPTFQLVFISELIHCALYNTYNVQSVPNVLQPFEFDSLMPRQQEIGNITLDGFSLQFQQHTSLCFLKVNCDVGTKILDYHSLSMVNFLDSCSIDSNLMIKNDLSQPCVYESEIVFQPVYLHVGLTALHTLNITAQCWNSFFSGLTVSCILPTYYLICNNIRNPIKFGQIDTDEEINLEPNSMHCYCWRSLRCKLLLRLLVKGFEWSSGFSLIDGGKFVQKMKDKRGKEILLFVHLKKISKVHTQIIVSGQITMSSRFGQTLELQITKHNDAEFQKKRVKPECMLLEQNKTNPSLILGVNDIKYLRLKLIDQPFLWSPEISIEEEHSLVQLPIKNSNKYIHVWLSVKKEEIEDVIRYFIIISPLYILRSHLPQCLKLHLTTPSINKSSVLTVSGQGKEEDVVIESSSPNITHQLNFQIGDAQELSSPSLPLSPYMIDQITKPFNDSEAANFFDDNQINEKSSNWPYCDENSRRFDSISSFTCQKNINKYKIAPVHPKIDLQVQLSHRWSCTKTLLIDVKPSILLINKSGVDFTLVSTADGTTETWIIPTQTVFTPPKLEGSFRLGIQKQDSLFFSDPLQLSEEDWSAKSHWPNKIKGIIPQRGNTSLEIKMINDQINSICQLSIQTKVEDGIKIICVSQSYYICNDSDSVLQFAFLCYPLSSSKHHGASIKQDTICIDAKKSEEKWAQPVTLWCNQGDAKVGFLEFDSYIVARHVNGDDFSNWSIPVKIPSMQDDDGDLMLSLIVPLCVREIKNTYFTTSYLLTCHVRSNCCFIIVKACNSPSVLLTNYCKYTLHFGQSSSLKTGERVIEEEDHVDCVPYVIAESSTQYMFVTECADFPKIDPENGVKEFKLNFCRRTKDEHGQIASIWSSSINVNDENDEFVTIPGGCDIRITKQLVGNYIHISVNPIQRAQILAKKIRSRINSSNSCGISLLSSPGASKTTNYVKSEDTSDATDIREIKELETNVKKTHRRTPSQHIKPLADCDKTLRYFSVLFKHISLILVDEDPCTHTELLRCNIDDLSCIVRPNQSIENHIKVMGMPYEKLQSIISVRNLQIDNQLENQGHDFPIIVISHDDHSSKSNSNGSHQPSSNNSLLHISFVVAKYDGNFHIQKVKVSTKPLSVYLEDKFLQKILDFAKVIDSSFGKAFALNCSLDGENIESYRLTPELLVASDVLTNPIKIEELSLSSIQVLLSLHTSIKLYLSIDETALTFKPYQKNKLFTSFYALGHDLTMHYLSGALFRAGWVVASMDLLGNPAGFVRSVGTGLTNFVKLPFDGILHGPWSFLIGISHGSASLVKHIASGTLMSVTNLASSVSRNMDMLSFDSTHQIHQAQLRKQQPIGISRGVFQGLNGLGYSLLGAIAGIVDKPLQNIIEKKSARNAVSAVVTGISQGMVGVVTKPIGGAAEFVAQTGQGILSGVGWSKVFKRRYKPYSVELVSISSNSTVKYGWKMISLICSPDIIFTIDSTHINHVGVYVLCTILLTDQALFIINERDDSKHQAYALSEIMCSPSSDDPTLIFIKPNQMSNLLVEESTQDRISEFVTKQDLYSNESSSIRENRMIESSCASSENQTKFCVHPKHRSTFLTLFTCMQRKLLKKGFSTIY